MARRKIHIYSHSIFKQSMFSFGAIISWLLFIMILLSIINAALPQFEMLLFSGEVPVPSISIKLLIIMGLFVYSIVHVESSVSKSSIIILGFFLLYLLAESALFSLTNRYSMTLIVFGYNTMYSMLIIAFLLTNIKPTIRSHTVSRIMLFVSVPLLLIGIAQSLANEPLLPLRSVDGYFQVLVWDYYGQVRAFSFFEAPAYYATFLIFFGAFVLANILSQRELKGKLLYFILFTIISISEFLSLNRTAMFAYLFVMFTVVAIYKLRFRRNRLILIMGASFVLSISLVFTVPLISNLFPFVFAFKDQSMFERYAEWQYWLHFLFRQPERFLLGSGIFQNSLFRLTKGIIIDNMFLAILVQIGAIGLVFVLYIIYKLWSTLITRYLNTLDPTAIASISLLTVWPIFAMFGTGLNIFPVYAAIPFLLRAEKTAGLHVRRIDLDRDTKQLF